MARVQTLDDDNKVDGEWYEVDDVIFDPSGARTEKVVFAPRKHAHARHDVAVRPAGHPARLPFVLTTDRSAAIQRQVRGAAEGG